MTIGIYTIKNKVNNKVYVGKSINCERRFASHKCNLRKQNPNKRSINRYLHSAFQKYGAENFEFKVHEVFAYVDEKAIAERELYWIDRFNACDRQCGYNLRRDSSTGMIVHNETRLLHSKANKGDGNPNFNNKWTGEQKEHMKNVKLEQHKQGVYNSEWRKKIGEASKKQWSESPELVAQMAKNVAKTKRKKHNFVQMNENEEVVRVWYSVAEIMEENPTWKWQNIYSVCNGYKKRIYGFKWRKVLSNEN